MITRIELENFMSHRHTVIEPARGLTVLVGPNNCGKSAVVSALQILCENDRGDYMVRHEEKECRIVLETDDGHRLEWKRRGAAVSYTIDGQEVHRLRGEIPEDLHRLLRLPKVQAADNREPYDIHFGTQKSPIFLLNEPGSRAATFFAASSDAAKLIEMQTRHREKERQAAQDERRQSAEAAQLAAEIAALEPVAGLQERVTCAERSYEGLLEDEARLSALDRVRRSLERLAAEEERLKSQAAVLRAVIGPPAMADADALEALLVHIEGARHSCAFGDALRSAMAAVRPPPPQHDLRTLEKSIAAIAKAESLHAYHRDVGQPLGSLGRPPLPIPVEPLERRIAEMVKIGETIRAQEEALNEAIRAAESAERDLRTWARDNRICPVCGAEVDADRLVRSAASGLSAGLGAEGHRHE